VIFLVIGILAGMAIGFLLAKGKSAAIIAENSLLKAQAAGAQDGQAEKIRLDESLKNVNESLTNLTRQARDVELKRIEGETAIRTQIDQMKNDNATLARETTKLAGALSNSQTRGKYGETQLEMLLEYAGLTEGVHFAKQDYRVSDAGISKPDIKIALPGGSELFIDSKFPFDRFLEAFAEPDLTKRDEIMQLHAKDLLGHVNALAKRGYSETQSSPDFVVLFAPFESILSEALAVDSQLLNKAFEKGITIATPTTMLALLRTVGHVFNQSKMAQNAMEITDEATLLVKRIGTVHTKIGALGKAIKSSEKAFNELVASSESQLMAPARRMVKLGVNSSNKMLHNPEIDSEVRELKAITNDLEDDVEIEENEAL
jgi:DNA recombination protein RmuC